MNNAEPTAVAVGVLARKEDWPERLAEFFHDRADVGFEWGLNDCCLFACDAVLAMTDVDLAADFRGKYEDGLGAARLMLKAVSPPVGMVIDDLLGAFADAIALKFAIPGIPVALAQRGDVVLFQQSTAAASDDLTLGIVSMTGTRAVSVGTCGAVEVPISECRRAWRIG